MTSYNNGPPSLRTGLINGAANKRRNSDDLPGYASLYIPTLPTGSEASYNRSSRSEPSWGELLWDQAKHITRAYSRDLASRATRFKPRDVLDLRLALAVIWMIALWWGEESTFNHKVSSCAWDRWESWPQDSNPHHLVFIADPQLVDPHTYPGRPWPLSTLTMRYTDLYMRKSFQKIRDVLIPDSVLFLGDLFDGGREWSNEPSSDKDVKEQVESGDKEWRRYKNGYWMKEYRRFGRIYFDTWLMSKATARPGQRGKKFIADLPGNHDLGLGGGIRMPARDRFNAYFGDGNRIDVIGNHTFVSLDTVSLSAKGQLDVETGTQGIREEARNRLIWEPVDQFLHQANARKSRAIERELRVQNGKPEHEPMDQTIMELTDPQARTIEQQPQVDSDIPSIILTHVPLYRSEGTPCGPLREKYPPSQPSQNGEYIDRDDRNAIAVQAGKQYQNVLLPAISNEIISLVGDTTHVFSGDDHDYCDLIHREYTSTNGGIREITVKSTSWAMGVRHPGFLLVSLWNPLTPAGKTLNPDLAKKHGTLQTHLCLLPDQLTIFIRYALLLLLTLFLLTARALILTHRSPSSSSKKGDSSSTHPLLPLTRPDSTSTNSNTKDHSVRSRSNTATHSSSSSSSASEQQQHHHHQNGGLAARSMAASRPRSISPGMGYGIPAEEAPRWMRDSGGGGGWNDVDLTTGGDGRTPGKRKGAGGVWREVRGSVGRVAGVVVVWYLYLLWSS